MAELVFKTEKESPKTFLSLLYKVNKRLLTKRNSSSQINLKRKEQIMPISGNYFNDSERLDYQYKQVHELKELVEKIKKELTSCRKKNRKLRDKLKKLIL